MTSEYPHLHEGLHEHGGPRMVIPEGGVILPTWLENKLLPMLRPGSRPPMTDPAAALDELNDTIRHTAMPSWRAAAIAFCEQHMGPAFVRAGVWHEREVGVYPDVIRGMSLILALCRPYLWRHEAHAMARDVAERLTDERWDAGMLHSPAMYWAREEDALVKDSEEGNLLRAAGLTRLLATVILDRRHVYRNLGRLNTAALRDALDLDQGGIISFTLWASEAGVMVPLGASADWGEPVVEPAKLTMAQCLFLQSKLAALSGTAAHRSARHRWERAHPGVKPPNVEVVTLRMREQRAGGPTEGTREYACRWPVRAHPHRYHYKGEGGEDVVRTRLVADYIKGPPDRPLRIPERRGTVYNVAR